MRFEASPGMVEVLRKMKGVWGGGGSCFSDAGRFKLEGREFYWFF